MRRFVLLFSLLMMLAPLVTAQEVVTLVPGEIVTGEITNAAFEVEYQFLGNPGEIIVLEMQAAEGTRDLRSPEILLLDADGEIVADTTENIGINEAVLVFEVPVEAFYTVIATREDGRGGDSIGPFTLELIMPEVIAADSEITGSMTNETRSQYYVVQSEDDFTITYNKLAGDFFPQVVVARLGEYPGSTDEVATASGDSLTIATIGVFTGGEPYFITIERALFDFSFTEVTADFALKFTPQS